MLNFFKKLINGIQHQTPNTKHQTSNTQHPTSNTQHQNMKTVYIDFTDLGDYEDFYAQLKEKLKLPETFGDNLDALYDSLTGFVEMPLHIEFVNMNVEQLETFEDLLVTLEEAEEELEDFTFAYFLVQYEDEDEGISEE